MSIDHPSTNSVSTQAFDQHVALNAALTIGNLTVRNRVWLAPMSGVSDVVFRSLADRLGAGLVFSEMIASRELQTGSAIAKRQALFEKQQGICAVQLAGNDTETMADAARLCADAGAELVDINFGCPAKKVTRGYAGSALMREPALAARIMAAVRSAVTVPVTVKMRLGWDNDHLNAPEIARTAEDVGLAAVTVHGRTRAQMYKGVADWKAISVVKRAVNIPVIVNGDITDAGSARLALELSGADAVMIGRAASGRPWLLGQIAGAIEVPTRDKQAAIIIEHHDRLLDLYGEDMGIRWARKHLSDYLRHAGFDATIRRNINGLNKPSEVRSAIRNLYGDARPKPMSNAA